MDSLFELLDVVIEEGASLFVSAVGVPPVAACEKLHAAGIPIKSSFTDTRMTSQHSALVSSLVLMGQRATNDLDKNNTLQCMRLRSIKYEMIISTDASYTMVVFQDSKRQ
jgi:predicted regulator of Ras-like GTPase activity (Roadblock/LC7/MglB family)